jgi:hypothetical protein
MTLFEILTRKIPFDNKRRLDAISMQIMTGKRPMIPLEFKDHPLLTVITMVWHQDPQQRPTAEELMAKLPAINTETQTDRIKSYC